MVSNKDVQTFMSSIGLYSGVIDGMLGVKSRNAMKSLLMNKQIKIGRWSNKRLLTATHQLMMNAVGIEAGIIDGYSGQQTQHAYEKWQDNQRDVIYKETEQKHLPTKFPRYKDMTKFYGKVGTSQVRLVSPYPLRLCWSPNTVIKSFFIHEKLHDSCKLIMEQTLTHYGIDGVNKLRLNYFGGCLNVRKMRGGKNYSTHSWGAAIDWDTIRNKMRMNHKKASFAKKEYEPWWSFWEAQGWISLGKEKDYDWQHVQAARF